MNRLRARGLAPLIAITIIIAVGCSSVSGGPNKVVLNEGVCDNVRFLQMKLNQTNRVVLDNKTYSEKQNGMSVTLEKFPVIVKGEVPAGSTIGDQLSTIRLHANAGEQKSVDLVPTFTGTFRATCGTSTDLGSGAQVRQNDISFQIK